MLHQQILQECKLILLLLVLPILIMGRIQGRHMGLVQLVFLELVVLGRNFVLGFAQHGGDVGHYAGDGF